MADADRCRGGGSGRVDLNPPAAGAWNPARRSIDGPAERLTTGETGGQIARNAIQRAGRVEAWRGGMERRGARTSQRGTSAPREEARCRVLRAGLHAGRAKHVQVQPGRRGGVLRPLFSFGRARLFLALLDDRKACHDGRNGNQSDT